MKKLLMLLGIGLGTTFSFAQTQLIGNKIVNFNNGSTSVENLPIGNPQDVIDHHPNVNSSNFASYYVYQGQKPRFSQNIQRDVNGNILFFIVDGNVYNRDGIMLGVSKYLFETEAFNVDYLGKLVTGLPEGNTETIILPLKDRCNSFRVISGRFNGDFVNGLGVGLPDSPGGTADPGDGKYKNQEIISYIIDFSQPSDYYDGSVKGKIVTTNSDFDGFDSFDITGSNNSSAGEGDAPLLCMSHHISATKMSPNGDFMVVVSKCDAVKSYKVSSDGTYNSISFEDGVNGYHQSTPKWNFLNFDMRRSESELVKMTDRYRHASVMVLDKLEKQPDGVIAVVEDVNYKVMISDLTLSGSFLRPSSSTLSTFGLEFRDSNGEILIRNVRGIEFSETGNRVWVLTEEAPYLWTADISNPPVNNTFHFYNSGQDMMVLTPVNLSVPANFKPGHLETMADGKIYFYGGNIPGNQEILKVINNPENGNSSISNQLVDFGPVEMSIGYENYYNGYLTSSGTVTPPIERLIQWADVIEVNPTPIPDIAPECCNASYFYDYDNYTLTQSETWNSSTANINGEISVTNTIKIPNGKVLTIDGVTVEFSETGKIVVERGGRLNVLNGAHLTAVKCENIMWKGIEVEGHPFQHSFATNQGTCVIQNSKISYAVNAVATARLLINNDDDANYFYRGGRIFANNSIFENNMRDLNVSPYGFAYYNHQIRRNKFICTEPIRDPNRVYAEHIRVQWNKNLSADDNTFEDLYNTQTRVAIASQTTGLSLKRNNFRNYRVALNAASVNAVYSVQCLDNNFTNNFIGSILNNVDFAEFKRNNYSLIRWKGAYFNECTGYEITENNFSTYPNNPGSIGTDIWDSNIELNKGDENHIYRNNYSQLGIGIMAGNRNYSEGSHPDPDNAANNIQDPGLFIQCNKFARSLRTDVFVGATEANQPGLNGVRSVQGICDVNQPTGGANNLFSHIDGGGQILATGNAGDLLQAYNQNNNTSRVGIITYQYHKDDATGLERTRPVKYEDPNTNPTDCDEFVHGNYDETRNCPSEPLAGVGISGLQGIMRSRLGVVNGLSDQLAEGNNQELVTLSSGTDLNAMRKGLKSNNLLSDEILINLANNIAVPQSLFIQICKNNAPLSNEVWNAVLTRTPVVEDWALVQISDASGVLSQQVQLALINKTTPLSDWALKSIFVNSSALTDEVLVALLNRNTPIASWAIRQVLMANTPLSETVNNAMYAHNPALPNWVLNSVNSSTYQAGYPIYHGNQNSERKQLENQIGYANFEYEKVKNKLIRAYLFNNDTLVDYTDSLKGLFTGSQARELCRLADTYIKLGDYTKANLTLDQVLTLGLIDLEQYVSLRKKACANDIKEKGCEHVRQCEQLNLEVEQLAGILKDDRAEISQSKELLAFLDKNYGRVKEADISNIAVNKSLMQNQEQLVDPYAESITFSMFPNPATDGSTITIESAYQETPQVAVFDISGQMIELDKVVNQFGKFYISTENLNSGTYFVQVTIGSQTETKKLNVIK